MFVHDHYWTLGAFETRHNSLEYFEMINSNSQSYMIYIISIGSKSNNVPLLSFGIFLGSSFYNNVAVGSFRITGLRPSVLGCSCFQLCHIYLGAVTQPSDAILATGFQSDMGCSLGRFWEQCNTFFE